MISSTILILFLPLGRFSFILPSSTSSFFLYKITDFLIGFLIRPLHLLQFSPDTHFKCLQPYSISLFCGPSL